MKCEHKNCTRMSELEKIISEKRLEQVFAYANFGNTTKRDVVKYALMKVACGYHNGHTSQQIINELKLTEIGKKYLYEAFAGGTTY